MQHIVEKPVITEKSLSMASRGWYTFVVGRHAGKEEIAKEVKSLYNVDVIQIRTVSMHGKVRRVGRKMMHITVPDWKKALVQLKKGQHIDAFEVPTEKEQTDKNR